MHRAQSWLSICVALAVGTEAAKTWVSVPIRAPDRVLDDSLNRHQADVSIGTPPQNTSFFVSIGGTATFALTPQCLFCPQDGDYDPKYSSSAKIDYSNRTGDAKFGGFRGNETITFGGVLQDVDSPLTFVDVMSPKFQARLAGGHLGLLVPPANDTLRQRSLLHRLSEQGQLLNPVWGLRLGGADPRLTIGALDPNEYQGDINWVPVLELEGTPAVQVSALRGYQGAPLPIQYPITAWMDSFARGISIQNLMAYVANDTLIGPQESISIQLPRNQSFGILCNDTVTPNTPLEFSVEINGVAYPINKTDLVRPSSGLATRGYCNVGVVEASDSLFGLGVTFLRSVYLAYRFPTETCPAYFGFAIPKGFPVPSPTQKPVATPTDAGTCLSFVAPSSTPTPTIATHTGLFGSNGQKYRVYSKPDDQVELRGVDELKERKLTGGSVQADG